MILRELRCLMDTEKQVANRFDELLIVSLSSTEFWDNSIDDELWNNT